MQVKDVLNFGGLQTAQVFAGGAGLTRTLNSVSVLEVAEKQISTWTEKNQLHITSFYAIRDDVNMQKIVIETLHQDECCGLVICHLGYVLNKLDPSLVTLCNELKFPLIVADPSVSFVEIINPIFSKLSDTEKRDRGDLSLRSDFVDLLIGNRRVQEALEILAFRTGREISFLDIHLELLYSNKSDSDKAEDRILLQEQLDWKNAEKQDGNYHLFQHNGKRSMLYYVRKGDAFFALLHIFYRPNDTDEDILHIADSLNLPCILLLNKKHSYQDMVHHHEQTYFSDLLIWNFTSDARALSRGRELGIELMDKRYFIVVNLNAYKGDPQKNKELTHYVRRWYCPKIEHLLKEASASNVLHLTSDTLLLLLAESAVPPATLADKILELFSQTKRTSVSLGISKRFTHFREIPNAYHEAIGIAIMGRSFYGENHVATFFELGMLFYLRQNLKQQAGAQELCQQLLEPLRQSDLQRETELLATAKALFQNQLNIKTCAEKLHIHRNTLLYRKNQIQDLMGYDPFSMPYAFTFMAALFVEE